ncbi:MAG TPA: choice-of-anchor D domain-containing protein [Rhodanobacteraceae bacterium]
MNHIYRLVWNRALHTLQVASETARRHGGTAAGSARTWPRRTPIALACAAARAAATPTKRGGWLTASIAAALIAVLQGVAQPAVAQSSPEAAAAPTTCTWVSGTNGNWSSAGSWSQPGCNSTFPGSTTAVGDNAVVANGTATLDVGGINAGALTIGNSAGNGSTVDAFGTVASNEQFSSVTIDNNGNLQLQSGAGVTSAGDTTINGGGWLWVDNSGTGGSTMTVGGNLTNDSAGLFGGGGIVVGNGGMDNASALTVDGTFTNASGDNLVINGGNNAAAVAAVTVLNEQAPATLEGTYTLNANDGSAVLEYGAGGTGITAIGDGGSNGASLVLNGAKAYVENGATNSNSALANLATIAGNGNLEVNGGASVTTSGNLTVDNGGWMWVDNTGGGSAVTVGGNLTNDSTGLFSGGGIIVGSGGNSSGSTLTVNGDLTNATGDGIVINGGNNAGAISAVTVKNEQAPSTLEGSYTLSGNGGTAVLEYGTGGAGITQIGDGASLTLNGPNAYVESGATNSNSALTNLATIATNGTLSISDVALNDLPLDTENGALELSNSSSLSTTGALTIGAGGWLWVDNNGGGGSTVTVGGNFTNDSTGLFGGDGVVVGNGNMGGASTLAVNGTFTNTSGDNVGINGGNNAAAIGSITVKNEQAPSILEGTYTLTANGGSAVLEYDAGGSGITQIGDGASNGAQVVLNGAKAYIESGATNSNSALAGLTTIASNGNLQLQNGASITTSTGLTVNDGGWLSVGANGGGGDTFTVGGNLANDSTGQFGGGGGVTVGNFTMADASTVIVDGDFTNPGGNIIFINGGNNAAAIGSITVKNEQAPSTLEGTYTLTANGGSAVLEYGAGGSGIAQIGDGGSNGAQLVLNGANAYVEKGATGNNSALANLATIASNGNLQLQNGASVTTSGNVTVDNGGWLWVDQGQGGGSKLTVDGNLTNDSSGQFSGGGLIVGNGDMGSSDLVTVNGSVDNATGAVIAINGNSSNTAVQGQVTVADGISNAGTVNINANGSLGVTGGNAYTQTAGTTVIAANGDLSAANVAINGGVLQGEGTVTGNVYNGAVVAGGNGNHPGTLTINGNFTNDGTGEEAAFDNTTAGTVVSNLNPGTSGSEQITVSGAVTLLGGTLQGDAVNGFNYTAGQTETVMNFTPGKLTGVFAGVQNGGSAISPGTSTDLGNGLTLGVEYNDQQGNVQLVVVNTPTTTTDTWSGGTGNWSTAAGWGAGSAPQFFSNVKIGGTDSGDVTLGNGTAMQDATVESLAINSGNTLAYQATTPTSLSVGSTVTVNAGGTLSLPTSGDQLELGGNFANSGTTTLGNGASLNTLGTFTNVGTGATTSIGNGASVVAYGGPTSIASTNGAGAMISLAGGSFNAPGLTNAGTVSGNGSINLTDTDIANTGLVEASGGTLGVNGGGIQGTGNITIDAGATLDLSHATAGSTVGTVSDSGSLNLGGNNLTVSSDYDNANSGTGNGFNARQGVTGTGLIDASGNVAQAVTGADVTGGTGTSPVLAFGNVHVGVANTTSYDVENTGTSGPSLRGAIQTGVNGGNITDATLTGTGVTAGNWGPVSTGGNASFGVTWTPTQAGAQLSGQTVHIANNFANVGAQTLTITGTAYAYADPTVTSSLATPFNFGVVQAGQTYTDPLTIANTLTASNAAYQEGLNAAFGTISNSQLTANGSITNLAAGQSNRGGMVVTLNPTSAGAIGGTVTIDFASNGDGTSGLGITNLNSQSPMYTWQFKGTVVNQANPNITPNPVVLNGRVGDSLSQALAVENVATAAPQASLDAQIGTISGAASSNNLSSINQLAAGHTDNASFVVGLNSATAGAQSGSVVVNLQSDSKPNGCTSNCIVDLTPETIQVSGNVYTPAVATVNTASPINFGIVHVGDGSGALSKSISVTNSAQQTALNDSLLGSVTATGSSAFTGAGSLTAAGLAAQQSSSALGINLNTASAGIFSGTANLAFASHDSQLSNLALAGDSLGLNGQVNNFAKLAFTFGSGVGALSFNGSTNSWTLNFGDLLQGSHGGTASAELAFLNDNPASESKFTDLLSTNAMVQSGSGFDATGDSVSNLAGGASQGGFGIGLNTSSLGNFSELLAFNVDSIDPDFNQNIGTVDLNLTGDIVTGTITPVPEPGSLPMFLAGLGLLGLLGGSLGFRRKVKQGDMNE